jgi:hypothetical protein
VCYASRDNCVGGGGGGGGGVVITSAEQERSVSATASLVCGGVSAACSLQCSGCQGATCRSVLKITTCAAITSVVSQRATFHFAQVLFPFHAADLGTSPVALRKWVL